MKLKNKIPNLKGNELYREKLINYIDDIVNQYDVVLINAPAGYGKTTSIISWIESKSKNNVSWISLDKFDNKLRNFLINLLESNSSLDKSIFYNYEKEISSNKYEDYILSIIEEFSKFQKLMYLIIDDLHIIESSEVYEAINYFIHNLPSNLKLIFLSRNNPKNISFSSLKRKNNYFELTYSKLLFNNKDLSCFLSNIQGISDNNIDLILKRTEGWIFSIQVLSIFLDKKENKLDFINNFSGKNKDIKDFLINEVVEKLDDKVKDFLLKTSFLDVFNYELANNIVGIDNSYEIIDYLIDNNLFIISLDHNNDWFRYHDLFSEFLLSIFEQRYSNKIHDFYIKTADWYKSKGDFDKSIKYASLIKNYDYIIEIIENNFKKMFFEKKMFKLLDWLNNIPLDILIKYPSPYLHYARIITFFTSSNKIFEIERLINKFEYFYKDIKLSNETLKFLYYVKSCNELMKKDYEKLKVNIDKMSIYTEKTDYDYLARINSLLGDYYLINYELDKAIDVFTSASDFFYKSGNYYNHIYCLIHSSNTFLKKGKLKKSLEQTLKAINIIDSSSIKGITLVYNNLIYIYYMFDDINLFNKCIDDVINKTNNETLFLDTKVILYTIIGLKIRMNLFEDVDFYINKLIDFHKKYKISIDNRIMNSLNIRKEIRQKNYYNCNNFINEYSYIYKLNSFKQVEPLFLLSLIESLIFTKNLHDAQNLIDKCLKEYNNFIPTLIEIYLLKVLVFYKKKNINEATNYIKKALALGEEENIVRIFRDSFKDIHQLILDTLNDKSNISFNYINNIKASFNVKGKNILTDRELEILKLISEDLSNEQISKKLDITLHTVKAHIGHIFRKFGIKNRNQAIEKLKEKYLQL
ncbi:MAG: LuxR C-terminal-related transcriptional regulator [Candidatus Sericytochromatia bacterium]